MWSKFSYHHTGFPIDSYHPFLKFGCNTQLVLSVFSAFCKKSSFKMALLLSIIRNEE